MGKYPQDSDGRGSLKDIQILVNQYPRLLDQKIKEKLKGCASNTIDWRSTLSDDKFAEYRDQDFIERLEVGHLKVPLEKFWPQRGPQWDALGKGNKGEVFLVEAKANIPEMVSPSSGASAGSLKRIGRALDETKNFLKINTDVDWSKQFYQYTNRLAHLYYFRELNKIPAYLIFIYFLNDDSVSGPETEDEWKAAITVMKHYLGIGRHKFSKYIAEIFINVKGSQVLSTRT